jgi:transposase-like protein
MTVTNLPVVQDGKRGRPEYSDAVKRRILAGLKGGYTRQAAAGFAGVHRSTLFDWIAKDPDFKMQVEQAEDLAEARYTATLRRAATGDRQDVRAAIEWLSRRRPAQWREKLSIDDKVLTVEEELDGAMQSDELDRRLQEAADDALRRRTDRAVRDAEAPEGEAGSGDEPS